MQRPVVRIRNLFAGSFEEGPQDQRTLLRPNPLGRNRSNWTTHQFRNLPPEREVEEEEEPGGRDGDVLRRGPTEEEEEEDDEEKEEAEEEAVTVWWAEEESHSNPVALWDP